MSDSSLRSGQRQGVDRRRKPTPLFSRYSISGRRREFRREGESSNTYVDRYSPRLMAVLTLIAGLCLMDALFTLLYIQRGGGELNPIMDAAIRLGVVPFVAIKCGLTFAGLLFLCLHKNFRFVKVIIASVLILYTALLCYHFYIVAYV